MPIQLDNMHLKYTLYSRKQASGHGLTYSFVVTKQLFKLKDISAAGSVRFQHILVLIKSDTSKWARPHVLTTILMTLLVRSLVYS